MVLSFSHKPDRVYLNYPAQSYKDLSWNFFINKKNADKISYNTFNDLMGLRIGATQDWSYTPDFWKAGLDLKIVSDNKLHLLKLHKGRIDAVPLNTASALYEINKNGLSNEITHLPKNLKSKPYFNAFVAASNYPNKEDLLLKYDDIVLRMKTDGTIQKIFDKYLK
jgi:polar amino acid transport system substrate-binding protein